MRWMWGVSLIIALSACSKEPDFDERYAKANAEIEAKVKELDAAVAASDGDDARAAAPVMKLSLPVAGLQSKDGPSSGE